MDVCEINEFLEVSRSKLNEQRKTGKYCDFVIKTKDNKNFTVHKNILESVSEYFEEIFNKSSVSSLPYENLKLTNDGSNVYDLEIDITSNVLENVLEYLYTGHENINKDNVKETINIATTMKAEKLIDSCTKTIIEIVDNENCFEFLEFAEKLPPHNSENLTKKCAEIITKKIETENDLDTTKLVNLPYESIKSLLSCDRKICSDEKLYTTITQWITYDTENREKYIPDLLNFIQFGNISYEFALKNLFDNNNPLMKNEEFIRRITIAFTALCEEQYRRGKGHLPIIPLKTKSLYTIADNDIFVFDNDDNTFSRIVTNINHNNDGIKELFAYTTYDENLLICGGQLNNKILNNCEFYSLKENQWHTLPHMRVSRYRHRATTLKDCVYVCGGKNEDTVEVYDVGKSLWIDGPCLIENTEDPGLCTVGNSIYVLKRNCQRWDPRENNDWTILPYYSLSNDIYSAVGYENKIYGFTSKNIVTFDLRNNKWLNTTKKYEESYSGYIPHSCIIKDKIYTMSEYSDNKFLLHSYHAGDLSFRYYSFINMGDRKISHGLFSM